MAHGYLKTLLFFCTFFVLDFNLGQPRYYVLILVAFRGLADMNGDGRMDFNEFSIACKLINLKLKGMELPKSLPPQVSPLYFTC